MGVADPPKDLEYDVVVVFEVLLRVDTVGALKRGFWWYCKYVGVG